VAIGGRIVLGFVAAFLVGFAAVLMWPQHHSRRRDLLISYGLGAYSGALGVILGWRAASGQGSGWAAREVAVLILLPLTATSLWAAWWTLRMALARRLPEEPEQDFVESAFEEGPAKAVLKTVVSLLPRRLVLLIGSVFFGFLTYGLGKFTVLAATGAALQEHGSPSETGSMGGASNGYEVFEVLAWLAWAAALIAFALWALFDREVDAAIFTLVLAGLIILFLYVGHWLGLSISPTEAVRTLIDWVGG
jgi:hypothetical protein